MALRGVPRGQGGGGPRMSREHFSHPIGTTGDLKDPMGSNGIIRNSKGGLRGVQGGQEGRPGSLMGSRIGSRGFLMIHKAYKIVNK